MMGSVVTSILREDLDFFRFSTCPGSGVLGSAGYTLISEEPFKQGSYLVSPASGTQFISCYRHFSIFFLFLVPPVPRRFRPHPKCPGPRRYRSVFRELYGTGASTEEGQYVRRGWMRNTY